METDCRTHKVVVKGEKADPLKVLGRLQRKSHRRVELISPIPEPSVPNPEPEPIQKPKTEDKKTEVLFHFYALFLNISICCFILFFGWNLIWVLLKLAASSYNSRIESAHAL